MERSSNSDTGRPLVVAHLLQAGIYGAAAWELSHRWWVDAALIAGAAAAQVLAAAARGRMPLVRPLCLLSLGLVAVAYGRFAAVAIHIQRVFGPMAAEDASRLLAGSVVVLPALMLFPALRMRAGWTTLALAFAIPAAGGLWPYTQHEGPDPVAVARALWDRQAPPPGVVRVTVMSDGKPRRTVEGEAATLNLGARGDALIVDVPTMDLPQGLARAGSDGPRTGHSPVFAKLDHREVIPGFQVTVAAGPSVRFRSAMASAAGVVPLDDGWSPAPELGSPALDDAVRAGVAHLAEGMTDDGRFTYIVTERGTPGKGYNYPRHAGTAWFLARAAAATGDPVAGESADRALAHLAAVSRTTADGRAYVLDPTRGDGNAWVGTTALAAMAARMRSHPMEGAWTAQVAAAVDAEGKVRGDMTLATERFEEQPVVGYAQGQGMLALADAERSGAAQPALDRAIRFLDTGYLGTAHPIVVGDEHWTCLATHAVAEVRGRAAGDGICAAYVATAALSAPPAESGRPPHTAGAAGGAEAIAAQAHRTGDARLRTAARDLAQAFLAAQYREADVPRIARTLIGGFRSSASSLDVQIDTVQHVGCALLGVEALLSGRDRTGSWP